MIALVGGTFDPIHLGHISLAREILSHYPVESLYFVPAYRNPHKSESETSPAHRLEMVRRGVREMNDPRVDCLDWEVTAPGPSYTIDTIEQLEAAKKNDLALVMGDDVFASFPRWKSPQKILEKVNLIIVTRNENLVPVDKILEGIGGAKRATWVDVHKMQALPLSATELRKELSQASDEDSAMPQGIQRSVWQYIKENRLYAVDTRVRDFKETE